MELVHFAPCVPGEGEPWDAKGAAAHFLRRTGFAAPTREIQTVFDKGLETAVANLFDESRDQEAEFQHIFDGIKGSFANFDDLAQLQAWWCYRMLKTRTPLREKLTLFWHGHFATSNHKVGDPVKVLRQIDTLRAHACGNFRDLVLAVSRDPAMLVYLDGEANTREHPNENFARELLELFTLGIGNYSEKDVREAARAFTGWHHDGGKFVFHAEAHDDEEKQFLGRRGGFNGADIIDILMQHPALPRLIARKLLVFFACPEPPEEVVHEAEQVFKQSGLNIKSFLSALFLSKFFYSPACRHTRISSPVEYVIGICRMLEVRFPAVQLPEHLTAMGQELFAPPNVKGWDGEKKWINATTLAARAAFAIQLVEKYSENEFGPHLDLTRLVPDELNQPKMIVDLLADRVLEGRLENNKRLDIADFLITRNGMRQLDGFRNDGEFRGQQIRAALATMLSLPEFYAY